jgi:hypothetical protein
MILIEASSALTKVYVVFYRDAWLSTEALTRHCLVTGKTVQ